MKNNTIPNSTQLSDWLRTMDSTLDEFTSFDSFTPFIYVVRETESHKTHGDLSSGIAFSDYCKTLSRIYGKNFDEDNHRFYTSTRLDIDSWIFSYFDKHEKKKDGHATWKDLVEYYYGSINNERKIKNTDKKIRRASYFKEEAGFNYEEYTGKLRTMLQQLNRIGATLLPEEEVSYIINGINTGNNLINMANNRQDIPHWHDSGIWIWSCALI